jgi:hypothetical protein
MKDETLESRKLVMYQPLLGIIKGGTDRASQITACICLEEMVALIIQQEDYIFLQAILSPTVGIYLV